MKLDYSLIKRFGNKKLLLKKIDFTKFFPKSDKTGGFIDLFAGTGAVSWRYLERMKRRGRQVLTYLNDKDDRLIRFFEFLQKHRSEFENALKFRWAGSERVMEMPLTELEDAVHFYLDNQDSTDFKKPIVLYKDFSKFGRILDYHKVRFTNYGWEKSIRYYKYQFSRLKTRNSNVILYCDPPYDETSGYKAKFDIIHFLSEINKLKNEIKELGINGYIFISLNKTDRINHALAGWYSLELGKYKKRVMRNARTEMLFSNRPICDRSKENIAVYFQ
jgi:site-specific DNA-adenine methylase